MGSAATQRPPRGLGVARGRLRADRLAPPAACRAARAGGPGAREPPRLRRRDALAFFGSALALPPRAPASESPTAALQREATEAYELADFPRAYRALSRLCDEDPANRAKWLEGRAQVGVDLKKFNASVADYGALLSPLDARGNPAPLDGGAAARFHAGRALAHEGLYQWAEALEDYEATLALARAGNFAPDPYVINAVGNCRASLGDYDGAREAYRTSAALFQTSKGFRNGASTTQRLDGAVYASANAALAAAQLGDEDAAEREFRAVARRAPNSADARAALAALLYASGRVAEAEEQWEQACTRNVGCGKYRDLDYVARVRRWPPAMVRKLEAFLEIR